MVHRGEKSMFIKLLQDQKRLYADADSYCGWRRDAAPRNAKTSRLVRGTGFQWHDAVPDPRRWNSSLARVSGHHGRILRRAGNDPGLPQPDRGLWCSHGHDRRGFSVISVRFLYELGWHAQGRRNRISLINGCDGAHRDHWGGGAFSVDRALSGKQDAVSE